MEKTLNQALVKQWPYNGRGGFDDRRFNVNLPIPFSLISAFACHATRGHFTFILIQKYR